MTGEPYDESDTSLTCEDKCKALMSHIFQPDVTWDDYKSRPAPVYGGKSAQQWIDEGKCEDVLNNLWALYSGSYT